MKEADVRRAIGLDTTLTTAQKYTLIMLLTRLDWETWTGQVSAHDPATISTPAISSRRSGGRVLANH